MKLTLFLTLGAAGHHATDHHVSPSLIRRASGRLDAPPLGPIDALVLGLLLLALGRWGWR